MNKALILLFVTVLLSACTQSSNTLDETSAIPPAYTGNEADAIQRINDLRMGKKPVVAPTKKTEPTPTLYGKTIPPPPGSSTVPPVPPVPTTQSSSDTMPSYDDLTRSFHRAVFKTNLGDITVELYQDLSPVTVNNFLNLAQQGFYDGTRFHRVIDDFMIQGGDPLSKDAANKDRWGTGGPGYKFADEFNDKPLQRGSLAMANSGPDTNGSQFFIVTKEFTPWLDGKHTNFGFVTEGMETVSKIEALPKDGNDRPREDAIIQSIELLP